MLFIFYKNRIGRQNRSCLGLGNQWGDIRKGGRRVSMVEILCIRVCKWKMRPVETIPGMGGWGEEEWWRG
jgi:hypothetical protein